MNEAGGLIRSAQLSKGVAGVARLHVLVSGLIEDTAEVVIDTETDRGQFVGAMVAAGYQVVAINPKAVDRYRDRHRLAGGKSDSVDAKVLADATTPLRRGPRLAIPGLDTRQHRLT